MQHKSTGVAIYIEPLWCQAYHMVAKLLAIQICPWTDGKFSPLTAKAPSFSEAGDNHLPKNLFVYNI